ncbi:Cotton fiber (DUF761) [Quillaja saponaria]|uniref:Cotton fiber (DUF761) n=1 Tax=Quillaja saponaria TaxID=32244 RepID=A0AAD7M679_QUISA|nr:Cotton fiber (DUF761) [Quillaja saponaria]
MIEDAVSNLNTTHQFELEKQGNEPYETEVGEEVKDCEVFNEKFIIDPSPDSFSGDNFMSESDEKSDDTLDATWKAIMEGQGKPITGQLEKSDTWTARTKAEPLDDNGDGVDDPVVWARKELKKSDTFNDTVSLRRDKSMSQDELNRRAEAFIQKINNQHRLQRLESDQRFREMVNRGVFH